MKTKWMTDLQAIMINIFIKFDLTLKKKNLIFS